MSADIRCDFVVIAASRCPIIMSAGHSIYYHHRLIGEDETLREVEKARAAMRDLKKAFAELDTLYPPTESSTEVERSVWDARQRSAVVERGTLTIVQPED